MKLEFQLGLRIDAESIRQRQVHLSIMGRSRFDLPYREQGIAYLCSDVDGIGRHTVFSFYAKKAAGKHVRRYLAIPAVAVTHTRTGNSHTTQVDIGQRTAVPYTTTLIIHRKVARGMKQTGVNASVVVR
jgi:hypothetical protein